MARLSEPSPYVEFDRREWRGLRMSTPLKLTEEELLGLRGLGVTISPAFRERRTCPVPLCKEDAPRILPSANTQTSRVGESIFVVTVPWCKPPRCRRSWLARHSRTFMSMPSSLRE